MFFVHFNTDMLLTLICYYFKVWDPVTGNRVSTFDVGKGNTITSMRTLPAPSNCIAVATTEGSLR